MCNKRICVNVHVFVRILLNISDTYCVQVLYTNILCPSVVHVHIVSKCCTRTYCVQVLYTYITTQSIQLIRFYFSTCNVYI